jgi:hypothetical protein
MGKLKTTIFLSFANNYADEGESYLECLIEEENLICKALDDLRNQERCALVREGGTTQTNLFKQLRDNRDNINIFYFSGHSNEEILQLEYEDGSPHDASIITFASLLKEQNNLNLVFLNSCKSENLARELINHGIPVVIGTTQNVSQVLARDMASQFYLSLASGASVKTAFQEAKVSLQMEDSTEQFPWQMYFNRKELVDWTPFPRIETMLSKDKVGILQISDINFSQSKDCKSLETVEKLKKELFSFKGQIDLLFFTGNLAINVASLEDYEKSYVNTLKYLGEELEIPEENIILASGLKDMDNTRLIPGVLDLIHSYTDNDELSAFTNPSEQFQVSSNRLTIFNDFQGHKAQKNNDEVSQLYSVYIREMGSIKLGIVSLNILWSDYEEKRLVFPPKALYDCIEKIKSTDYKILLSNVSLSNLKTFNRLECEDLVYRHFDFIFLGSKKDKFSKSEVVSSEGIFSSYSGFNQANDIDYQIISFDPATGEINQSLSINKDEEELSIIEEVKGKYLLPKGEEKTKQIKLVQNLHSWLVRLNSLGDDLFVNYKEPQRKFVDLFTPPILREKPIEEIQSLKKPASHFKNHFENIKNKKNNYIIFGKDKSGKSSLLVFLGIHYLDRFHYHRVIPFYLDLEKYNNSPSKFDLVRLISKRIEFQKRYTEELIKKYHFRLLLDNFDPSNNVICDRINTFLEKYDSSFIICSDQTTLRSYEEFDYGFNSYDRLFIHDITRKEIRSLVTKTVETKSDSYIEEIVQKIVSIFKQHRMPFNYWTVSIFLWVISKRGSEDFEIQNNSQLIELYIQELLGQRELALQTSKEKFPYHKYKKYLSYLAHLLYKKHESASYSASYKEIISITESFLNQSRRNVTSPEDVVKYILQRGVLKKVGINNYSFRLNGVFEYFLANEMVENDSFLSEVINDDALYLSFKNELDLYSGFERRNKERDKDFLVKLFEKTREACREVNERFSKIGSVDEIFETKTKNELLMSLVEKLDIDNAEPLSYESKDKLQTAIEENGLSIGEEDKFKDDVQTKKRFDENAAKHEIIETYLFIMGRVFRNIEVEGEDSKQIDDEIFGFLLDSICNWGFLLFDELVESRLNSSESSLNEIEKEFKIPKEIIKVLYSFVPLIVQDFLYHSLGHITLENIIKHKIEELEVNSSQNQFQLFMLYFLLIDLDLKGNKNYIEKALKVSKAGNIRFSIAAKIIYYLFFKAQNNTALSTFLKRKFRELQRELNPKADSASLNRNFSEIEKMLLLNKRMEDN